MKTKLGLNSWKLLQKKKYIPRAFLMDLELATIYFVKAGPFGQLFRHNNLNFEFNGMRSNWAKGVLHQRN